MLFCIAQAREWFPRIIVGDRLVLISPFAYMISSAFWGYKQRMAEYGDQAGLVDPRVKVTTLLMTMRGTGETWGRKFSIY